MRPTGQNEWDKRMRRMWFLRCRDRHVFIYRHTQYTLTCISRWSLMICKQIRKEFHFRPSRACSHSVCGIVLGASKNKVRLFWYWCDLVRCFFFYFILIHCYCVCVFEWPSIPSQSFQSLNHLQNTFGIIYIAGSWQTVEHAESISSDNCIYHPSRLHSTAAPSHESEVMKKKTKQNGIVRATSTIYSWLCLVYGASSCFACLAELANTHTQTHTSSTLNMWTMNTSALARMPQTGVCMKLKEEEVEKNAGIAEPFIWSDHSGWQLCRFIQMKCTTFFFSSSSFCSVPTAKRFLRRRYIYILLLFVRSVVRFIFPFTSAK